MDSDHLTDVMNAFDESFESETMDNSNNQPKGRQVGRNNCDQQDFRIREQIDDAEPTFYNDSSKIELQINESPSTSGINTRETDSNINNTNKKEQRYVPVKTI